MIPQHQPIPRKPVTAAPSLASLAAYSETLEIPCEDCEGLGFDRGALDFAPPVCPACKGRRTETVKRNFLSEAFAIVSHADSTRPVERKHLVAIVRYAREHVSVLFQLPEVA
jgi:hypothetical protein